MHHRKLLNELLRRQKRVVKTDMHDIGSGDNSVRPGKLSALATITCQAVEFQQLTYVESRHRSPELKFKMSGWRLLLQNHPMLSSSLTPQPWPVWVYYPLHSPPSAFTNPLVTRFRKSLQLSVSSDTYPYRGYFCHPLF